MLTLCPLYEKLCLIIYKRRRKKKEAFNILQVFFFFQTSKQEAVRVHIPIINSMTVQTHITSFNNPSTVHTYTIRYTVTQEQVNSLLR